MRIWFWRMFWSVRMVGTRSEVDSVVWVGKRIFLDSLGGDNSVRKAMFGAGMAAMLLSGAALIVGAQGPPPPGDLGGPGPGPGGPMIGMFEFGV